MSDTAVEELCGLHLIWNHLLGYRVAGECREGDCV